MPSAIYLCISVQFLTSTACLALPGQVCWSSSPQPFYFKEATMLALGHTASGEGLVVEENGRGLPVTLWEGCDELQPRSSVSVKILKALLLIPQVRAVILCCSGKENNIDYNHMNTTINKSHSYCRLRLGRHKMVENSMEVRSTVLFTLLQRLPRKEWRTSAKGRGEGP